MSDFRRAVAWYEEILGLEAESYWPPEALKYAYFETGAAQFAISELDPVPAAGRYNFSVRDVDAWWEKLRGRAEVVEPLFDTPYGTRKFTVRDRGGRLGPDQRRQQACPEGRVQVGRREVPPRPPDRRLDTAAPWYNGRVKAVPAVAFLAVVGFAVAGCGSGTRAVSGTSTVTGTTTIMAVKVGTRIRCKGGPAARVPHWFGGSVLTLPGVPGQIALTHRHDGSVTVSCRT